MKKILAFYFIVCLPLITNCQELLENAKQNVWISNSNDNIVFTDSTFTIFNLELKYDSKKDSTLGVEDKILVKLFQDSIVFFCSEIDSLKQLRFKYSFYDEAYQNWRKITNIIEQSFDSKITFYKKSLISKYRKCFFIEIGLSFYGAELKIDSLGVVNIRSNLYNPFFKVNKGSYVGLLDSTIFSNLKNYLFEEGHYKFSNWLYYYGDVGSCMDCSSYILTYKSKSYNQQLRTYRWSRPIMQYLQEHILNQRFPENVNLNLKESDFLIPHEAVFTDYKYLEQGVESVIGNLSFITKTENEFLYSLKVDSVPTERGVLPRISKNKTIYFISKINLNEFDSEKVGIVIHRRKAFHSLPLNPFKKYREITYYEMIQSFPSNKSIYLDYFGKYRPYGMSSGIVTKLQATKPIKKGLFDFKKFTKLERKIYRIKTQHNIM